MTSGQAVSFPALGTTAVILTHPSDAVEVARGILESELAAIDLACSRFRVDSELVQLNERAGQWQAVSPLLFAAIKVAMRAWRETDGAVDPTIGSSMRLLGYDRTFAQLEPDGPPLQLQLQPTCGANAIELDERRRRVRLPIGVELDLGATAKAFAADRAAHQAAAYCGAGVLVGLGGDLCAAGTPKTEGWPVRVLDDHRGGEDTIDQNVAIRSGGLATSSVTVRTWRRGGDELHHIIDPATGYCAQGPWRTVSVAAASCVDANSAATAAIVKGSGAIDWLERLGLPARLVTQAGDVQRVAGWPGDDGGRKPNGRT